MADGNVIETSPDYRLRLPQWRKVRDALAGEEQVKSKTTTYMPKPRGMKAVDYANYLARAEFYGVTDRTLRGLVGMVFRVDPVLELPSQLEYMGSSQANPEGFNLSQLIRETEKEVLSLGRYGMLVDRPQDGGQAYIATWMAEEIYRWDILVDPRTGFRRKIRVVVEEEPASVEDDTTIWLRDLFIDPADGFYKQQKWKMEEVSTSGLANRKLSNTKTMLSGSFKRVGAPIIPTRFGEKLTEIPFIFVNTFDLRSRTDKPPMLDLVNTNMAHYRNSADYEQGLHMIGSPTPYLFGIQKEDRPTTVGPSQIWTGTAKDVKVGMLEYNGTGVGSIRTAMEDKEDRMAVLGARLIRGEDRENVTAETTRLEAREETSVLLAATRTVELAYEQALFLAATWEGVAPEAADSITVKLNRDFIETRLTAPELLALVKSWQDGAISDDTFHFNLQRGEIVDPTRSVEDEKAARDAELTERKREGIKLQAEATKAQADANPEVVKPPSTAAPQGD